MRIHTHKKELSNEDLRVLSNMTGKSVRELKRLRKTKYYVVYNSSNGVYEFLGIVTYLVQSPNKSPQEFFDVIREHQLTKIL